jgi:hypothetical protein
MGTTIEIDEALIKAVDAIPLTLRNGPLGKCLGAFGETIARACKSQARSSRGGSRLKWSKKYKNNPAFQNDSRDHFGHKVMRNGLAVYVGATYPKGNKQQFVMPINRGTSYQRNLWGKPGQSILRISRKGKTYTTTVRTKPQTADFPIQDRAPVKAFDITKSQAGQAFMDELQKQIKELRLG